MVSGRIAVVVLSYSLENMNHRRSGCGTRLVGSLRKKGLRFCHWQFNWTIVVSKALLLGVGYYSGGIGKFVYSSTRLEFWHNVRKC